MSNDKLKTTLRERKKAQPKAVTFFSEQEKSTIVKTVAKGLDEGQIALFFYTCQALGLNPLLNEIACVTYKNQQGGRDMSIQVMRDGFLTIAHRSGKFAGLESGVNMSEDGKTILSGWAKVYHKDFTVPVYQEADFNEYTTNKNLWASKPKTMIKKVAESMALRKAFNINGVYSPEEMDKEITPVSEVKPLEVQGGDKPITDEQMATLKSLGAKEEEYLMLNKQEAAEKIKELATAKK